MGEPTLNLQQFVAPPYLLPVLPDRKTNLGDNWYAFLPKELERTLRADYIKSETSLSPFNRCSQLFRQSTEVTPLSLSLSPQA